MEIRRTVDSILIHKNYTSRLDYDAALVRLSEPVNIHKGTSGLSPVCLPTEKDFDKMYIGENATILGWGQTSESAHSFF